MNSNPRDVLQGLLSQRTGTSVCRRVVRIVRRWLIRRWQPPPSRDAAPQGDSDE